MLPSEHRAWLVGGAALILAFALTACGGGSALRGADAGRSQGYAAGEPSFDLEVVATVQDDVSGLDILLSLPRSSVVYRTDGSRRFGSVRWTITVSADENRQSLSRADTLRTSSASVGLVPLVRSERVVLPAGEYVVEATAEDEATGRLAVRRVMATIPDVSETTLTGLRLEGALDSSGFTPLVALSIPSGIDSLRAVAQVIGIRDSAQVRVTVARIPADLEAPQPPFAFTPMAGSLQSRGVDLSGTDDDTVSVSTQPLDDPSDAVTIVAPLPSLLPGVYRIRMTVLTADGTETVSTTDRLIVARSATYPTLSRMGDLIGPLKLIASPREWARLRDAPTHSAQRYVFDRFWGENIEDRRVAAATIRAFYERVEEANRRYASQKDGWRTDRGMVFLFFGPPEHVQADMESETWTYGGAATGAPSFTFERTAEPRRHGSPYDVYTLRRDVAYESAWRRAIRMWRRGEVP